MLRPRPLLSRFDDGPYWDFCRQGELRVPRCGRCGRHIWPILPCCPDDWSDDLEWARVSGVGMISSFVVYRRVYHPEFKDMVPYICANVELPEGVRVTGNVYGEDGTIDADRILGPRFATDALNGRRVELFFEDCGHGLMIPQWRLTSDHDKGTDDESQDTGAVGEPGDRGRRGDGGDGGRADRDHAGAGRRRRA